MRTPIILILLAAFLIPARAAVRPHLLVETNGTLVEPAAFFTANQSAITALSSGVYQPLDADLTAFAGISGVSGDIIYHNGSSWVRLAKGSNGQTLQLSSGFPTWATVVGGAGDVTLAGTNAFTGPNSFAGVTTLDGSVYINGATTISNQLTFKATGGSGDARLKWTGNKMLLANDTEISSLRTAGSDVAFGTFFAGSVQSYAVRADGMMSWSDGTNAASAVFGPRRIEDRMNGVVRLSGGLGITERSSPPTPENNTGTIWLESATTKSIKVSWPDGTSSAIGAGGGGGDAYLANNQTWSGTNTFNGLTIVSNLTVTGTASFGDLSISNLVLLTPMAPSVISNPTPSRIAMFDSSGRLTNDVADTGTGAPVRAVSPALTGSPTVPTASAGVSNTLAASTAYVDRAVAAVPSGGGGGSSTNDRIASWTADRFSPGTNATTQAQYRILGDGIPAMEFDGSTSEETSAIGVWQSSVGSSSYVVLTFASDDTANTVCWQVQLQSLALRGLDTNAWATASAWTSNVPGTARVSTNIIIPITSHPFSGSGTNDYGKPYMLRVTRLPGSDSSLSNAFLLSVDHRFTP